MANTCSIEPVGPQGDETMPKDQAYWNAAAIVFFVVLSVATYALFFDSFAYRVMSEFRGLDLVVLGLATFRLIRLAVYDKIFAFVRDFFMDEHTVRGAIVLQKPPGGFRRLVAEMMECIWCIGLWAGGFLFALYLLTPYGWFLAVMLAMSAAGSFLQNLSQMVTRIGVK